MKKNIQLLSIIVVSLFLFSSACKEITNSIVDGSEQANKMITDGFRKGRITNAFESDGCDFLIELTGDDGSKELLSPIKMTDSFKKEGINVLVKFHYSRIQQEKCMNSRPIIIDDIQMMKK
jgi:hypothetical protein